MKSTGVVRQLDTLGRIVLPIELRRTMDIGVKDMLEIFVEGDEIILKKYHPSCIFCSDARDVVPYKGKLVCKSCLAELRNAQDKSAEAGWAKAWQRAHPPADCTEWCSPFFLCGFFSAHAKSTCHFPANGV